MDTVLVRAAHDLPRVALLPRQYRPHYETLVLPQEIRAYDAYVQGVCRFAKRISMPRCVSVRRAFEIARMARLDIPELFFVRSESASYAGNKMLPTSCAIEPVYRFDPLQVTHCLAQLEANCRPALEHAATQRTAALKVECLHDWLTERCSYNKVNAGFDHNAAGPLLFKKGRCDGFALAFKFLLDRAGVRSWVCTGQAGDERLGTSKGSGGHAWNIVDFGGSPALGEPRWHHVDVCFDLSEAAGEASHAFFGMSDREAAVGHELRHLPCYPRCPTSYEWYRRRGGRFLALAELERALREATCLGVERMAVQLDLSLGRPEELASQVSRIATSALDGSDARSVVVSYSRFGPNVFTLQFEYPKAGAARPTSREAWRAAS